MADRQKQADEELTQPLLSSDEDPYDALPVFIGSTGSDDFRGGAEVRFITLENKPVFDKVQSRSGNVAKQRVHDGVIQMEAISPVGQILSIRTWVFREPNAAQLHKDKNGPVELQVTYGQHNIEKQFFSVNLDSVYDGPIAPVYELAKVEMDKRNLFQLIVELSFHNGAGEESQSFYSKPFLIRSRPRNNPSKAKPGMKRPRIVPDSTGEEEEGEESPVHFSPDSSVSMTGGSVEFQNLRVIDHLEAKRAHIEHLSFVVSNAGARKADIGYHFKLKDPDLCEDFEEGDVVGFFKGDDGRASIQLLNNKNGKDAVMAGVVSRSAYLEATPSISEDDPTDVVCVIGVIKVKCVGSVRAGERIYASVDLDNPGTAIPESHLPPSVLLDKTSTLLGMAMEEKKASKLDDVHLVQCFVCIVLGVCDKEIASEIESMYHHFEMDLAIRLRRERKKTRRLMCVMGWGFVILLILVAVFMYEYLYPGSALRYWICKQGSIPGHRASFRYIPTSQIHQRCDARGIEFTWDGLEQKMSPHLDGIPPLNSTAVPGEHHYYLNWDRCAHGGANKLSAQVQGISNNKQICGPIIFAINFNCSIVYYYQDKPDDGWKNYTSVENKDLRDYLKCIPAEEFKI